MNLPNPFPGFNQPNVDLVSTITKETQKFNQAGQNGTLIAVVLDESGSMSYCRASTISGFNEFVQGQKNADSSAGQAYLTLVKFSAPNITTVYQHQNVHEVEPLSNQTYSPLGGTNLLDAVGQTMMSINNWLGTMEQNQRPGVIITIMTDGHENSSQEYSNLHIKNMVVGAEQADWTFNFLGANVDAFSMGSQFGMNANNTVNYSTSSMAATLNVVSESVTRMRAAKMAGASTSEIYSNGLYTEAEINKMKG